MCPTVCDVAERAGVSPATGSRAMQGNRAISEATRATVLRAAVELGYVLAPAWQDPVFSAVRRHHEPRQLLRELPGDHDPPP